MWDFLLLPPKLLYVTMALEYYGFYVFRPKFIERYLRLAPHHYGDILALMAMVSFPAMTGWGILSDWLRRPRLVMGMAALMAPAIFCLLLPIAGMPEGSTRTLLIYLTLTVFSLFISCLQSLCDAQVLAWLEVYAREEADSSRRRRLYGRQRMFDSATYGLTSALLGELIDRVGLVCLFPWLIGSSLLFVGTLAFFGKAQAAVDPMDSSPEEPALEPEQKPESPLEKEGLLEKESLTRRLGRLLSVPSYLFLLSVIFMVGLARAIMALFLAKFLEEHLHLKSSQVGYASAAGILLEVAAFLLGPIITRYLSLPILLLLAQATMVLRSWLYVLLPPGSTSPWAIYAIELLKGLAFGLAQLSGVQLARQAAPEGLESTAQTLYAGVYGQLPAVLAASLGGRIYGRWGAASLFFGTACMSTVALALFTIFIIIQRIRG